jgi:hypothetical protein
LHLIGGFYTLPYLRGHLFEENQRPAGYARLVAKYDLKAPLRRLSLVSEGRLKADRRTDGTTTVYDKRYWPRKDADAEHLDFAMKYEPIDLLLLKKAFEVVDVAELTEHILQNKYSASTRRLWFAYEWLTGRKLALSDLEATANIEMLDAEVYYALGKGKSSTRQRIIDNLPGTQAFCPIARRAAATDRAPEMSAAAKEVVAEADPNTVRRAAAFLLLSDSKSSFAIEGESPPQDRIQRWGRAIGKAGLQPIGIDMLADLQKEIIDPEKTSITLGLRTDGVWIGERDREYNPRPDFIGARHEDLNSLMMGIVAADRRMTTERGFNPIVHAAGLAFGFVYIHPFEDGNGRLHRYLINHALAEDQFFPKGVVLPISDEILKNVGEYSELLRGRSGPLLDFIEWRADEHRNVEVLNDTADLYRYPDVTDEAAFLAKCLGAMIEHTLPKEIAFLESYDAAIRGVSAIVDMPNNRMSLLVMQTVNNKGVVPKKRRKSDYKDLTDDEMERIESVICDAFGIERPADPASSLTM